MNNADYAQLSRKQLITQFEQERREWLEAGMSEADVHRVHFGEENENGRGGDYAVWLAERGRGRADHKYAPGTPVAIDTVDPDGARIGGGRGGLDDADFSIDLEKALSTLTELQRFCFVEVCLKERSYTDVAKRCGKHHSTIQESVRAAKAKLKNFFS
jgi:DNA-directed RNA polymerase specialized sigma24 family protein